MNKILKDTLLNISNKIESEIENYYYINSGGCALFAHLIHKELYKRNIECKIKIYKDVYGTFNSFSKQSLGLTKNNGCNHVVLRIGKHDYDSEGFDINRSYYESCVTKCFTWIPRQSLNFYNKGEWNDDFKELLTENDLKHIKLIIKNKFKNYDKEVKTSQ